MAEHEHEHEGEGAKHGGKHGSHGGHGGHGGGHAEHEEGVPEWVVSFADNALLQMGFFVILLALNMKPASSGHGGAPKDNREAGQSPPNPALLDAAIAIREAFNNPVSMTSSDPNDAPLIRRIIQRREGQSFEDGPRGDKHNVQTVRPTDYHRTSGLVLFDEGSTKIDKEGQSAIAEVAKQLKGRKTIVEVRGHASLAEAKSNEDMGMGLSYNRAIEVGKRLREAGLEWEQLRIVACGAGDRAAPIARGADQQRANHRVEVIVTDELMPQDPYSKDPKGR